MRRGGKGAERIPGSIGNDVTGMSAANKEAT